MSFQLSNSDGVYIRMMLSTSIYLFLALLSLNHSSSIPTGKYIYGSFDLVNRGKKILELEKSVCQLHTDTESFDADADIRNLTRQYLHGFDGRIDLIISKHSTPLPPMHRFTKDSRDPLIDTSDSPLMNDWNIVNQATSLKLLLTNYKFLYGERLRPMYYGLNVHHLTQIRFDRFLELHKTCTQLMSELDSITDLDRRYYYVLKGEVGNFKIMIEQIGADIAYPGLSNLGLNTARCLNISLRAAKIWNGKHDVVNYDTKDDTVDAMVAIRNGIPDIERFSRDLFAFLEDVHDFIVMSW